MRPTMVSSSAFHGSLRCVFLTSLQLSSQETRHIWNTFDRLSSRKRMLSRVLIQAVLVAIRSLCMKADSLRVGSPLVFQ